MIRGLYSDGTPWFSKRSDGKGRRQLLLAFRALAPSGIRAAWVRTAPDGEEAHTAMRLHQDPPFERWEARVELRGDQLGYRFELLHPAGLLHFNQAGLHTIPPYDNHDFVYLTETLPPDWLHGTTCYQIFPDRFAQGDLERFRRCKPYTYWGQPPVLRPWGSPPLSFQAGGHMDFFGGDLGGIQSRIPYLEDLGVGALYLNPVFHAPSNHRYDTQDYRRIDPRLGTNKDFAALTAALHQTGIRIILDGVFNHVGSAHRWFNREGYYKRPGAFQSLSSPYAEFFHFDEHPFDYDCWLGIRSLPKLDYRSRKLRREIYAGPNAITKQWLRSPYNIDGWRFDVANMLARNGPHQLGVEVFRELRQHLKALRPDLYLVGEHYFDPTDLLDGTCLDGVMNYKGFYFPLVRWLTRREPRAPSRKARAVPVDYDAACLARELMAAVARYPAAIVHSQLNHISTHDTARLLSVVDGNRKLMLVAATLLLTWPGVPCVYYGDEVGLKGKGDPSCRGCMPWDDSRWDQELRSGFRKLIRLRREQMALARGGLQLLKAEGDVFCFARIWGTEMVLVALNRSSESRTLHLRLDQLGCSHGEAASLLSSQPLVIKRGQALWELGPTCAEVWRL